MFTTDMLVFSFTVAIVGYTWINLLISPGDILDFVAKFIKSKLDISKNWQAKLQKVLTECEMCFSGQLAFWLFPFFVQYTILSHALAVVFAVFFAKILNRYA